MHVDHNIDDFRPPFVSSAQEGAQTEHTSPAHVDALTTCLTSIHESLDVMCSLDQKTILGLPTIFFARTSYVAVALIKLFSATSAQDSRLGQVFDPADLKVEYYLDKVTRHFKEASNNEGGRTVAKFAVVLTMLKNWFMKRKDHDSSREGSTQQKTSVKGEHDKVCYILLLFCIAANSCSNSRAPLLFIFSAKWPWMRIIDRDRARRNPKSNRSIRLRPRSTGRGSR